MTFEIIETSEFLGEPIELYVFNRDSMFWRFTTPDGDEAKYC